MSTKAIRKVIEAHRALVPEVRGTPAHEMMQALDEVEAIERAAKFYAACPAVVRPSTIPEADGIAARTTVESVAKDAP